LLLFLDPGSEIRDPGWVKIRIRDKHPGSATLPGSESVPKCRVDPEHRIKPATYGLDIQ
jgi:hypothetical protein